MEGEQSVTQSEHPVTRREFEDFASTVRGDIATLSSELKDLVRAKQVNWPLVVGVLALAGTLIGVAVKNLVESAATSSQVGTHADSISDFRERIRATESQLRGLQIEEETQHRWLADSLNQSVQYLSNLSKVHHPEDPPLAYWPLAEIGKSGAIGNGH